MDAARRELRRLLLARALRALADGYVAVLLPAYLLALGHQAWAVGLISSGTLLGSALATLALGAFGHRWPARRLLSAAALLMAITGAAFGTASGFWPLLVIAFVGTLNPSAGDVSVFLPLEHARLATLFDGDARTRAFARYTIVGSLSAAFGALLAGLPAWLAAAQQVDPLVTMRAMFVLYGAVGVGVWALYRGLPADPRRAGQAESAPLDASRPVVVRLALLFSVDAFAGGLVVNASQWLAPRVAERFGLLNTMVFTHIPSNLCLIGAAFASTLPLALALLFLRSALSQMDVPTRSAFVMAVVTPAERPAAASFTAVPRSLAAALSPALGGAMFAAGFTAMPLALCGALKIGYDLALWTAFRSHAGENR